jgi:5-methylcytosine-specific restriction endonuclease McrA
VEIMRHNSEKLVAYNDGVVYAEDKCNNIFQRSRRDQVFYQTKKRELLKIRPNCHYCNMPLTFKTATIDHAKSLRYGGTDKDDNLVLACHKCNFEKGCK